MALNSDDLKIVVGAQLTTKEAQETLKNFVKTSSSTKIVLNTEVDSNGIEKISKIYKTINKYIDENGNLLETATHQRQLSNGTLSAENGIISKVVEGYKKLNKSKEESFKNSDIVSKSTKRLTDAYGRLVTETIKYNKEGNRLKQVITESKDVYGVITKTVDEYVGSEERLLNHYVEEYQDLDKLTQEVEKYNASLKKTNELKEKHSYINSKGQAVTVEYSKDEFGKEIKRTITEEENLGITVRKVTEQVREQGIAWSKSELISEEKISNEIDVLKQLGNQLEEVNRWRAGDGSEVTKTHIIDALGKESVIETKKYLDDLGNTVEETTTKVKESDGSWRTLGTTIKKSQDSIAKAEAKEKELAETNKKLAEETEKINKATKNQTTTNNTYKKTIDGVSHEIKEETVQVETFGGVLTTTTKKTDTFRDSQGRLVTEITKVDSAGKTTTETFIEMGKQAHHLGQTFGDIIIKVTKFYVASLPVRAVQTAITETIQAVKDFDSALTEFKKVSDLSGESLDEYTEKLEKLGSVTARTKTEMVQIATEFKRSGFSDEESAKLAQVASMYQNIADEELSAADASAVLISQMKAFQKEGITAEHVIDSINEVANRNAVSSGDIGRGLTQAGAALSTYGNNFNETIGLITAGTEINFGKSPNSLN